MATRMKSADFQSIIMARERGKQGRGKQKGNKYGAQKQTRDGITFDSKREARRYADLKLMEQIGEITDLKLQVPIYLMGQDGPIRTPTGQRRKYVCDFTYKDRAGRIRYEDSKGFQTKDYKLKRDILAAMGITIEEV